MKSLSLVNRNTVSMYWKDVDYNFSINITYKFLYINLLKKITERLFNNGNTQFISFISKKKLYYLQTSKENTKYIKVTAAKKDVINKRRRLMGSILISNTRGRVITFVSFYRFQLSDSQKKKKNVKKKKNLNLYFLTKLFKVTDIY